MNSRMLRFGKIRLYALLCISLFGACKLDSVSEAIIVTEVEDEFYVDLWENLSPNGRNFILKIRTIENQECANTEIDARFSGFGTTLRFLIDNIIKPKDCIPGFQPAAKDLDAGKLSGAKIIQINLKNTVENKGNLAVEEDRYLLDMETDNGFLLLHDELLRVPEGAIWGYVTYQKEEDVTIVDDFLLDLENISMVKALKGGYYGHFTITNNAGIDNSISIFNQPSTSQIKTFVYDQGDKQTLVNLLNDYRNDFEGVIDIKLLTANGEEL